MRSNKGKYTLVFINFGQTYFLAFLRYQKTHTFFDKLITYLLPLQGFKQKIVGGMRARNEDFPWLVLIGKPLKNGTVFSTGWTLCGGTIISQYWVLTAAHCLCSWGTTKYHKRWVLFNTSVQFILLKVKCFIKILSR